MSDNPIENNLPNPSEDNHIIAERKQELVELQEKNNVDPIMDTIHELDDELNGIIESPA